MLPSTRLRLPNGRCPPCLSATTFISDGRNCAKEPILRSWGTQVPPHLSKKDFKSKSEALMHDIFQNDQLDEHVKLFEFLPREPFVVIATETEVRRAACIHIADDSQLSLVLAQTVDDSVEVRCVHRVGSLLLGI
ncbi:hypothetical protein MVEN_01156200 [Mycena venus]|uniref:Uncharacterized protein n=1 Tax=Mycena venus TaxID=2733690 RepID=A0A8H7CXM3_9AGAR|nr:hypothetical protein MVEN_01156200 [Mycena venus]